MATIQLPQIFQNGMVLQRRKPICVWGTAEKNGTVTVALAGETACAAVECGRWKAYLPPMEAASEQVLSIGMDSEQIEFSDIAIGEVWIAGGQSNMEFLLRYDEEASEAEKASDDLLRFFEVPKISYHGQEAVEDHSYEGLWRKAVLSESLLFSAVGYYFGQTLRSRLDVPVGIIGCNWGGISASCMTDPELLTGDLAVYLDEANTVQQKLDETIHKPLYQRLQKEFKEVWLPRIPDMGVTITAPMIPDPETMGFMQQMMAYHLSQWSPFRPCGLYETMLKTIAPYSLSGVIWYQGETDANRHHLYGQLFTAMVRSWRRLWHDTLPFIQVQLASYEQMMEPIDFVPIRAVQEQLTRDLDRVYIACAMDAGLPYDIHPKHKRPVGTRLAYQALGKVYGIYELADSPMLGYIAKKPGTVHLEFKHCGHQLSLRGDMHDTLELHVDGKAVTDYTFELERNHIHIYCPAITARSTVNVCFAWKPYCSDPVYNSNDLPMLPFNVTV